MSGMTKTRLSARISSAAAVVGRMRASQMILALIPAAFWLVITFSVAAGMRISPVGEEELAGFGGVSAREADDCLVAIAVLQRCVNVHASTIEQSAIVLAIADDLVAGVLRWLGRVEPSLPKPWMITRVDSRLISNLRRASSQLIITQAGGFAAAA